MERYRSSRSLWGPRILRYALLAVMIGGCTAPEDSRTAPGRDAAYSLQTDPPGQGALPPAAVAKGKQLFGATGCTACHAVNGQGGTVGPDLSNEGNKGRSRQWLTTQIRDPKANDPQTAMPADRTLSAADVNDLVDYLLSLSTAKAGGAAGAGATARGTPPASSSGVAEGGRMWAQTCGRCHNLRSPSQYSDAQWQVAVHHMRVRVPLTGEQQREILAFLQATN